MLFPRLIIENEGILYFTTLDEPVYPIKMQKALKIALS